VRAREVLARSPWLYCAAARARRGRNRSIVGQNTDLLVEGFPRSGNTFAVAWLALALPDLRVASHVHHPAHVRRAQQLGVPALVVIRPPRDSVLSNLVYRPDADPAQLLDGWLAFHDPAVLRHAGTFLTTFAAVTGDMGAEWARVGAASGIRDVVRTAPRESEVLELVQTWGDRRFGGVPDHRVARPTSQRAQDKLAAGARLDAAGVEAGLAAAQARYEELVGADDGG
jgi:hypothetical protein